MAWLTPPIFKPGDADAEMAASILGAGRSSRLYKALVYEKQIAQTVSAFQNSLILGSMFQIEATARPGHTAEELERAIDEELAKLRAQAPSSREIEQARNTIETAIIGGLERLGGFGGVADRLNLYNHYLRTPDYLDKDIQRYRAVTPATLLAFARDQLTTNTRVVVHAIPGQPKPVSQAPAPAPAAAGTPSEAASRTVHQCGRAVARRNSQSRGRRSRFSSPRRHQPCSPNGLTLILSERRGLPIVAANLVIKTGSDANPIDRPGLANFVAAMLDEGTATPERAADCGRGCAAWRHADDQQQHGRDDDQRAVALQELRSDARSGCGYHVEARRFRRRRSTGSEPAVSGSWCRCATARRRLRHR